MAGFASHGTPAYSWWGSFLHSFVVPNAGTIGADGIIAAYRQRHPHLFSTHLHLSHKLGVTGTAAHHAA